MKGKSRMRKFLPYMTLLFAISILYGCDKERIVTTTETVHETEYIEMPPDTVRIADTLYLTDTNTINSTDTLFVQTTDTVYQTNTIFDTVNIIQNIYDTVTVVQTVTDTLIQTGFVPAVSHAYSALQFKTDPEVLQYINTEFGLTDGWIFYLSSFQNDIVNPSEGVYDIYGYIDYWTPDWSSYYPLEYYYRVTYTGGDPADAANWQLTDPPATVNGSTGGITIKNNRSTTSLK